MSNLAPGAAVPIPTLPLAKTVKSVLVAVPAVVEAIVKSGVLAAVEAELEMESKEYGEVVPIPVKPLLTIKSGVVALEAYNFTNFPLACEPYKFKPVFTLEIPAPPHKPNVPVEPTFHFKVPPIYKSK
jgi:hypothetical protein